MKKKIYYGHHLYKYNTPIEDFELSIIREKLSDYEIFNPSTQFIFSPHMTEDEIMLECLEKVKECDALVFSSLSGVVGRGEKYLWSGKLWSGSTFIASVGSVSLEVVKKYIENQGK